MLHWMWLVLNILKYFNIRINKFIPTAGITSCLKVMAIWKSIKILSLNTQINGKGTCKFKSIVTKKNPYRAYAV